MQKSFSRAEALKVIVTLAWPTVLEQVLETAVSYVDSAMVGRVGAKATAAVGATITVNWLINSTLIALGIGFLSYISHEIGAKRPENARRASAQAALFVLLIGLGVTAVTLPLSRPITRMMRASADIFEDASRYFFILYIPMLARAATTLFGTCLRAAGDTRTPLKVTTTVNLVNIVLNFLLIYPARTMTLFGADVPVWGAGLGVTGAAVASAFSFLCGGVGMTAALLRNPLISPKGCSMKPDGAILRPVLRISLPCALQRFCTSFGYVIFATLINSLGTLSIAAHSVANTVESAFYIPGYGMQTASATLAANCWGADDPKRLKLFCRMLIAIEVALMLLSGTVLFCGAGALARVFTVDNEVSALAARVLRIVAVTEPIYGVAVILEGIFQGVGDTKAAFVFNILGMWGVRILGTFICLRFAQGTLISAWVCMVAHNILLGTLLLIRYLRGNWNPLRARAERV